MAEVVNVCIPPRGLTVRVTTSHQNRDQFERILSGHSVNNEYVYCAEGKPDGDGSLNNPREHFHAWFVPPSDFHQHSLRNLLTRIFGKGNKRYSITMARNDVRALAYFMKGGDYKAGQGVSPDLLERARVHDAEVKAQKAKTPDTRRRAIVREVGLIPPEPGEPGPEYLERVIDKVLGHHLDTGRMCDVRSIQAVTRAVIALSSKHGRQCTVKSIASSMQRSVTTYDRGDGTPAYLDPYAYIPPSAHGTPAARRTLAGGEGAATRPVATRGGAPTPPDTWRVQPPA